MAELESAVMITPEGDEPTPATSATAPDPVEAGGGVAEATVEAVAAVEASDEGEPDLRSIDALIASLSKKPEMPGGTVTMLRPAPEALDLKVLKRLADDPAVRAAYLGGH